MIGYKHTLALPSLWKGAWILPNTSDVLIHVMISNSSKSTVTLTGGSMAEYKMSNETVYSIKTYFLAVLNLSVGKVHRITGLSPVLPSFCLLAKVEQMLDLWTLMVNAKGHTKYFHCCHFISRLDGSKLNLPLITNGIDESLSVSNLYMDWYWYYGGMINFHCLPQIWSLLIFKVHSLFLHLNRSTAVIFGFGGLLS